MNILRTPNRMTFKTVARASRLCDSNRRDACSAILLGILQSLITLVIVVVSVGLLMAALPQDLPTGHPAVRNPATTQPVTPSTADKDDVETISAIVNAYYDVISGPAGQGRDWDRFQSLFMSEARLITTLVADTQNRSIVLTPAQFVEQNRNYFERGGYFEKEINQKIDVYGNIAHVLSTYASRRTLNDPSPYSRGINSIQLIRHSGRWWIVTILWDRERPDVNPIPRRYLPEEPQVNPGSLQ